MRRPVRSLIAACGLLLAATAPAAPASAPKDLGRSLDAWAKPLVERGLLSGNLLVAVRDSARLERW